MRRREFIAGVAGALAVPRNARAQRMRRIGVLSGFAEGDPSNDFLVRETFETLSQLGWEDGRNVLIDRRWAAGDINKMGIFAKELVALQPDVIVALTTPVTASLQRETNAIPIVFLIVSDPIGSGFVASLARPGGNITGFINIEASLAGKSLAFLKEIAPRIEKAANMFNPDTAPGHGSYHLASFEGAARSLAIEPIAARVHGDADIDGVITSLGREQGGLVVTPDPFMAVHRGTIIELATRNKVPAAFDFSSFAKEGGLLQYGPSYREMFRLAASYLDRLLRGAKPSDLPVELPTKFELVVNLKTAKALGLTVPETLLATADEVIE